MIGKTLSHFKIVARLGEGGMGVVYKAMDEKLHRPVALKTLPQSAVADEARRGRLLREARSAASLSHPNIATIHEVDEVDGVIFIAMEYIEGRTLRALLRQGPLEMQEVVRLGAEIAEGLAEAHRSR